MLAVVAGGEDLRQVPRGVVDGVRGLAGVLALLVLEQALLDELLLQGHVLRVERDDLRVDDRDRGVGHLGVVVLLARLGLGDALDELLTVDLGGEAGEGDLAANEDVDVLGEALSCDGLGHEVSFRVFDDRVGVVRDDCPHGRRDRVQPYPTNARIG